MCHHRLTKWFLIALFVVISLPLAIFTILLLDRREPVHATGFRLLSAAAKPGSAVVLEWQAVEMRKWCTGRVHRTWIDANGVSYDGDASEFIIIRHPDSTYRRTLLIPVGMAAGPALYVSSVERWCNGVQERWWRMWWDYPTLKIAIE
jgi:hypothetical protein